MPSINFRFVITPPPGLTDVRQLPHKWQQATVERIKPLAVRQAGLAVANIKGEWIFSYPQGWGTVPRTLKTKITESRTGISVQFSAAGRELQWITSLGGGLFEAGATFDETPSATEFMSFFWKRFGRWARMSHVTHPGWDRDVLAETFEQEGQEFQQIMVAEYDRGATQLLQSFGTPKPVASKTRRGF